MAHWSVMTSVTARRVYVPEEQVAAVGCLLAAHSSPGGRRSVAFGFYFRYFRELYVLRNVQVLDITREMVTHARSHVDDVEFSAEDALRSDYDFLSEVCTHGNAQACLVTWNALPPFCGRCLFLVLMRSKFSRLSIRPYVVWCNGMGLARDRPRVWLVEGFADVFACALCPLHSMAVLVRPGCVGVVSFLVLSLWRVSLPSFVFVVGLTRVVKGVLGCD